ncbi:MAG TPA: hypothetical protein VF329_14755 [Gammaproteobacteria bacterium]
MKDEDFGEVPFSAHVELLQSFLAHREEIVARIEGVLNAQRKPVQYLQDHSLLSRHFEDCFFALAGVTAEQLGLRGRLEEAHWASGFRPRHVPELHNDLVHPAEMMRRAFHCWQQTRWPGRNGRVRYAHTLFNLYVLRCLELLSMRLWDAGASSAAERLSKAQNVLDALWRGAPADQPVLLRDARWLIPLAQSPTTEDLAGYFEVATHVAESLTDEDRIEIQKAHVQMIGGHLCSQIRHYCLQDGVSLDEKSVVLRTRTSNALDFALLIRNLVPLLEAYERVLHAEDGRNRLELARAVCHAVSPDPELFLNRIDLLGAYGMIEHLFVATDDDGRADYTAMGRRHVQLLHEYEALIGRLAEPLYDDCHHFEPVDGAYSPYGAIYGTPSNLTEHMALKTLQRDAVTHFSLEDVFVDGGADKVTWVNGWRRLPHIDREVQRLHEYPHRFAREIHERIERAFRKRVSDAAASEVVRNGRLFVVPEDDLEAASNASIPELPVEYVGSSDRRIVAAGNARFRDQAELLRDRQEGHFVVSYETSGGWVAIKKDILTEVLGAGHDAKVVGLPPAAAGVLGLTCPGLVAWENVPPGRHASAPPSMLKA